MNHSGRHTHGEPDAIRRLDPPPDPRQVRAAPHPGGACAVKNGVAAPRVAGEQLGVNEVLIPSGWTSRPHGWVQLAAGSRHLTTRYRTYDNVGEEPAQVHVGRYVWPRLVVRPGDPMDVEVLDDLPEAERVLFDVATSRTDGVREHIIGASIAIVDPLYRGADVDIEHPSEGRLVVRVREVRPEPSHLGTSTTVDVVERDQNQLVIQNSIADVGGAAEILDELRRQIELPLLRPHLYAEAGIAPPKGALLHGPPGTGKTLILRAVARSLGVTVKALSGGDLARSLRGETEKILRDLFREAVREAPTLVLIDEFDAIGGHRDRMAAQDDVRAVSQLLSLMDGLERMPGVVVLASTNRLSAIDEAFLRPGRFDLQIKVGAPSESDRLQILGIHFRDVPLTQRARLELGSVARQTAGYVGADLMHLARLAALRAVERAEPVHDSERPPLVVDVPDVLAALSHVRPSSLATSTDGDVDWGQLVGLDPIKDALVSAAKHVFAPIDRTRPSQGVLLYGPPGNGKSALARALARELDVGLVTLEPARIFRPWLGESETALLEVFERAELTAPSLLVIEHLAALANAGSSAPGERTDDRVKAALIAAIDEVARKGVLIIGIARDISDVDPQITRSGRLGIHLHMANPADGARRQLLSRRFGTSEPPAPMNELVAMTDGHSAADILHSYLGLDRVDTASAQPASAQHVEVP